MIERRRVTAAKTIVTNGHEYIDFGLPSGTLWATLNVGQNVMLYPGYTYWFNNYNNNIASAWGGSWRVPTKELFLELIDNLVYWYTSSYNSTGVAGVCFGKSATSSTVLFFPAFGYGELGDDDMEHTVDDGKACYYLTNSFDLYVDMYAFLYFISGYPNKTPLVSQIYTSEDMLGHVRLVITP